jgi:hypothetical protein
MESPHITDHHAAVRAEIESELDGYRRFGEKVKEEIERELCDPELELFHNIRSLTLDEWERFDIHHGVLPLEHDTDSNDENDEHDGDEGGGSNKRKKRKVRSPVAYRYHISRYEKSAWYKSFLSTDKLVRRARRYGSFITVRELTDKMSRNSKSAFRAWFRMPLYKVEELVDRFIREGWVTLTHHCRTLEKLQIKTELLILGTLAMLGGTMNSFRQLPTVTNICATDHNHFFLKFVRSMYNIRHEYISLPKTEEELSAIMRRYEEVGLPGAMGSLDVVHVKWSSCPSGDYNRCKGKEGFPTLGFKCITDYDRKILGVFGPQFGTQNDKHIVKLDENVAAVCDDWYSKVKWNYFNEYGHLKTEEGLYLICDNGYIQWPTTICPFMRSATNGRLEECFSSNLESVRKDVECVFGILKCRWTSLDKGLKFRRIDICQQIFFTCCILHNMMLDEMVREAPPERIGRGCRMPNSGMWLNGPTVLEPVRLNRLDMKLRCKFDERRMLLANHLRVWKETAFSLGASRGVPYHFPAAAYDSTAYLSLRTDRPTDTEDGRS